MYSKEPVVIVQDPAPVEDVPVVISGNYLWSSGAVEVVSGDVQTWTVDDTELPLDQNTQTWSAANDVTDPNRRSKIYWKSLLQ